jgi:hypothetical protein
VRDGRVSGPPEPGGSPAHHVEEMLFLNGLQAQYTFRKVPLLTFIFFSGNFAESLMFQKSHHSKQTAALDLRARIVANCGVTANDCSASYVDHVGTSLGDGP